MIYDRRYCYSQKKLMILNFYLIFGTTMQIETIAYKLGIKKAFLNRIVDEWKDNNHYVLVESKINQK